MTANAFVLSQDINDCKAGLNNLIERLKNIENIVHYQTIHLRNIDYDSKSEWFLNLLTQYDQLYLPEDSTGFFKNKNNWLLTNAFDKLNTENVVKFDSMFENNTNLTNINLSKWTISNIVSMTNMFKNCTDFTSLTFFDISSRNANWTMTNMFSDTPGSGKTLTITRFDGMNFSQNELTYLNDKIGETLTLADGKITKTGT